MRFMLFVVALIVAAGFLAVMVVGIALRVALLVGVVVAALAGGAWLMRKLKGPSRELKRAADHLPR